MIVNILGRLPAPSPVRFSLFRKIWGWLNQRRSGQSAYQVATVSWSIDNLRAACERKHIRYEESSVYENLRGVVVRYGRTSIISVKASLPEQEKIAVLAHELAHVALQHTQSRPQYLLPSSDDSHPFAHDPEKEQQAQIWAAHLLVRAEVFERLLRESRTAHRVENDALQEAIRRTADALNIPASTVKLWTETRSWVFPESPKSWLDHA